MTHSKIQQHEDAQRYNHTIRPIQEWYSLYIQRYNDTAIHSTIQWHSDTFNDTTIQWHTSDDIFNGTMLQWHSDTFNNKTIQWHSSDIFNDTTIQQYSSLYIQQRYNDMVIHSTIQRYNDTVIHSTIQRYNDTPVMIYSTIQQYSLCIHWMIQWHGNTFNDTTTQWHSDTFNNTTIQQHSNNTTAIHSTIQWYKGYNYTMTQRYIFNDTMIQWHSYCTTFNDTFNDTRYNDTKI